MTKVNQLGLHQRVTQLAHDAIVKFKAHNEIPTLILCGKTGAGKSSLMNALVGVAVQEVGVIPTTQTPHIEDLSEEELSLRVMDLAGFGESGRHKERLDVLFEQLEHAHLILLVVGYPDRSLSFELEMLQRLQQHSGGQTFTPPLLVALNKIDLAPPIREWDPTRFQLANPTSAKEMSVAKWVDYTSSTLGEVLSHDSIPCAVGEFWNDRSNQYGIQALREGIYEALPEAAKTYYVRIVRDEAIRERRARGIITTAALTAAAAGSQPIPVLPDAMLITPIQVGMIIALAQLHGGDPSQIDAQRLLGPVIASVGGRLLFQQIIKWIPGLGTMLGASIAGILTYTLGETYHYLMKNGIWEPEKEQLVTAFARFWEKNKGLDFSDLFK